MLGEPTRDGAFLRQVFGTARGAEDTLERSAGGRRTLHAKYPNGGLAWRKQYVQILGWELGARHGGGGSIHRICTASTASRHREEDRTTDATLVLALPAAEQRTGPELCKRQLEHSDSREWSAAQRRRPAIGPARTVTREVHEGPPSAASGLFAGVGPVSWTSETRRAGAAVNYAPLGKSKSAWTGRGGHPAWCQHESGQERLCWPCRQLRGGIFSAQNAPLEQAPCRHRVARRVKIWGLRVTSHGRLHMQSAI
jgi:hypothetical protein